MAQTKAQLVVGLNVNASAPASALQIDASGNVNLDSNTLYVDATNNRVGIGTSSPDAKLEIVDTASSLTYPIAVSNFTDPAANVGAAVDFRLTTGGNSRGYIACQYTDNTVTGGTYLSFAPNDGSTGNIERMRITKTGAVGIGTTSPQALTELSSASAEQKLWLSKADSGTANQHGMWLQFANYGPAATARTGDTIIGKIHFYASQPTSGNLQDAAAIECRADGNQSGGQTPSYLVFKTTATNAVLERARIDSSGRLLVGTSSESGNSRFVVRGNTGGATTGVVDIGYGGTRPTGTGEPIGTIRFTSTSNTASNYHYASITAETDAASSSDTDIPGRLVFSTTADGASSPTERMRITKDGQTLLNYLTSSPVEEESFGVYGGGAIVARFNQSANASGKSGIRASIGSNGNNTSTYHFSGNTSGVNNWYLYGNGTTSYSSDERLKKNIETTREGYLEDIRALRVVKYNWKDHEDGAPKELGLIAQEVEQVFPGLVQDDLSPVSDEDPTIYKQLKGSVLPVILLKALQEAAAKIETLEARLTALESA